ncbi:MAG: dihydroorotate dehydrogenase electron transfer subunit [Candidatus Omnitrophota bacterium]|nr:dihydroorotate dehydrogenase electron transfer subunit [Candidatus Omnitrophota bacterium]
MLQIRVKILYNKKIKGNYFHLVLQAPEITKESLPGQFLMVQESMLLRSTGKTLSCYHLRKPLKAIADHAYGGSRQRREGDFLDIKVNDTYEPLLRRPLSIHRVRGDNIELLYEVVGRATEVLSCRKPGECLDAIGPLGNGFNYPLSAIRYLLPVLVAGGMGVAPLLFLAEKIKSGYTLYATRSMLVLIGAKTKNEILCEKEFKDLGCEVKIATDDGSRGLKGKVTELLKDLLLTMNYKLSTIYACGPRPMLKEISRISKNYKIPAQVSLEEHMACGIGACLGCVVNTKEGFKRVCKEGPIFKADEIAW